MNPNPNLLEFLKEQGLAEQVAQLEKQFGINLTAIEAALDKFVTQDARCIKLKEHVRSLATHEDCVLIQGETGTGKEIIARALGANRPRGHFVAINVAAIPSELVESTLFGYKKGAFTGASQDTQGLIQYAGEGTVFLDEIGDLDLGLQAKFLRVLQDRKVRRVGSLEEEEVKCRFIAASHFDLRERVSAKEFRLDLYARLSTFILKIPSLSSRKDDIPVIMKHLNPAFPVDKVDWNKVDLSLNIRHLEQYARRYAVLEQLPTE